MLIRPAAARLSILGAMGLAVLTASTAAGPDVRLEGSGEQRTKLDAISYKPFDTGLCSKLTDWTGGDALTPESISGKVVLFVTWSSWYKTSFDALRTAQTLHSRHSGNGLIVVGVHHKEGWARAAEVTKARDVQFRTALDKSGDFRKALHCTQDPDFYLVDRAGRLRYADIETASVEAATDALVAESRDQAAAAARPEPSAAPADAGREAAASGDPAPGAAGFKQPDAAAYAAAKWPAHNSGQLSAKNMQGKPLPKPLGKEKYLGTRPDRNGKVTVIDFWATWCGPCRQVMPSLDSLQKANPDDLVVIGLSDEPEGTVKGYLKKNPHGYAQAVDPTRTLNTALQVRGIPHVIVLSSDGVIRWQGHPAVPDFKQAVADCIAADPGVKARRSAGKS